MATIVLPDALTIASVRLLRTQLLECFDGTPPHLVDARAVDDVDGAGVQLLLSAARELKSRGLPLQLATSPALQETLVRLAVLDRFSVETGSAA